MTGWLFLLLLGATADASKIPVYRTPESVFHSGYAQHSVLKKNTKSVRDVQWTQVRWRGKEGWIQQRDLLPLSGTKNKILTGADGANLYSNPTPKGTKLTEIPGGELLERKKNETVPWGLAELSELGEVWWPMREGQSHAPVGTTTDLSKRPIFDMITLPSSKNGKIVSADGIYRSTKTGWKKIEQFGDDNHPLAVAADGTLFVGPFLSRDEGKTFRPYVNWQNFLKPLHENDLMNVRLQSIEVLDEKGKELQILAETHKKKYQLYSRDSGKTWNLIR